MSSPGPIQEWLLESIYKRLETAFLWEQPFDSLASLCNNGVNKPVSCQNKNTIKINELYEIVFLIY
jgi:hypothetical protein